MEQQYQKVQCPRLIKETYEVEKPDCKVIVQNEKESGRKC